MKTRGFPAMLVTVLALSACGGNGGSAGVAGSVTPAGSAPGTTSVAAQSPHATAKPGCGDLQMKGNSYQAVIIKGHPDCADVIKTFHSFFAAAKTGGKATVSGWTCAYKTAAVMKKTKIVAVCAKKSEEIAAKK